MQILNQNSLCLTPSHGSETLLYSDIVAEVLKLMFIASNFELAVASTKY